MNVKLSKVCVQFLAVAFDYIAMYRTMNTYRRRLNVKKAIVEAFPGPQVFKTLSKKVNNYPINTTSGGHLVFFVEKLVSGSTLEVLP